MYKEGDGVILIAHLASKIWHKIHPQMIEINCSSIALKLFLLDVDAQRNKGKLLRYKTKMSFHDEENKQTNSLDIH